MSLHHHKKHWLFHATMWVCAVCVLLAFGFVSWKFNEENKWLVDEVDRLTAESMSMKGQLKMCTNKTGELQKSVEGIVETIQDQEKVMCEVVDGNCGGNTCLVQVSNPAYDKFGGTTVLSGYYTTYKEEEYWEQENPRMVTCHGFIITGGSQSLIDYLSSNHHRKNEKGQVILGIHPDHIDDVLSPSEKQKLMKSNFKNPVYLTILKELADDRGGVECNSGLIEWLGIRS